MSRWQRFKHAFVACRGPEVKREYRPPTRSKVEGRGPEAIQLIEEAFYGVTLKHHKCSTCGQPFVNRELGDVSDV